MVVCQDILEEVVSRACLFDKQGDVEDEHPDIFDVESDKLLVDAVSNQGQGHLRPVPRPPDPPDPVVEADIRSKKVVREFIAWRGSRSLGLGFPPLSLESEKTIHLTLPLNPDLETVFGAGASRLAIEYLGPSGGMVCNTGVSQAGTSVEL